jgi:cytochrome b pre-mRNA-processing protein 3
MPLATLFRRKPHERAGFALYTAAVGAARDPGLFAALDVPDSLDGRFDLIGLQVALLIRRLRQDPDTRGPALAQAVFDAMFADMDMNLREMGVSDLSVGRRVKTMWEAFHGRAKAYEAALDAADPAALAVVLERNVWRRESPDPIPSAAARALAGHVTATAAALAGQDFAGLLRGKVIFPPYPQDAHAG